MSRRSAKAPVKEAPGKSSKTSVGTRQFDRRAKTARRRTVRRPARPARTVPAPLLRAAQVLERIPRAAWICAIVAVLNAACWSIITPPFQLPDEPSHFAYTQQLVENLALPKPAAGEQFLSPEEREVMTALHQRHVRDRPATHTITSAREQRILEQTFAQHLPRRSNGEVGGAASDPPLYYLLEAIPYVLASPGTALDQLELMRLMSALMAGVTALFVFLFVRETLPAVRWAWTVGGLAVALTPILGYMSGAVNPDAMLFTVSAAIFYCLARAFRRGLSQRLAVAIGTLTAAGILTKINFLGLVPGVILGLIVLTVIGARARGLRAALLALASALAIAGAPAFLYVLGNLLSNHPALGIASITLKASRKGSVLDEVSYIWQFYLPHLPGMKNYFPGISTIRQLWFDRSVGFYGWLDTSFPVWVDNLALLPAALVAVLCVRALIGARAALRAHLAEIAVYGAIGVGLMVLIGASAYYNISEGTGFAEPRYLLPLLPLLGAALALAARGAGRRWGPSVGALIVVLFLAHDIFSQLLVVGRFYG
jgi:hypothetical protein